MLPDRPPKRKAGSHRTAPASGTNSKHRRVVQRIGRTPPPTVLDASTSSTGISTNTSTNTSTSTNTNTSTSSRSGVDVMPTAAVASDTIGSITRDFKAMASPRNRQIEAGGFGRNASEMGLASMETEAGVGVPVALVSSSCAEAGGGNGGGGNSGGSRGSSGSSIVSFSSFASLPRPHPPPMVTRPSGGSSGQRRHQSVPSAPELLGVGKHTPTGAVFTAPIPPRATAGGFLEGGDAEGGSLRGKSGKSHPPTSKPGAKATASSSLNDLSARSSGGAGALARGKTVAGHQQPISLSSGSLSTLKPNTQQPRARVRPRLSITVSSDDAAVCPLPLCQQEVLPLPSTRGGGCKQEHDGPSSMVVDRFVLPSMEATGGGGGGGGGGHAPVLPTPRRHLGLSITTSEDHRAGGSDGGGNVCFRSSGSAESRASKGRGRVGLGLVIDTDGGSDAGRGGGLEAGALGGNAAGGGADANNVYMGDTGTAAESSESFGSGYSRCERHKADHRECSRACSKVMDHVFVGGREAAEQREVLLAAGITHVLSCAGAKGSNDTGLFPEDFTYLTLRLRDVNSEDISCAFFAAIRFIDAVQRGQGRVFVHCSKGISRSPTVVMGYLMWRHGLSFDDAFGRVRLGRPICCPNPSFLFQLQEWGARWHVRSSVSEASMDEEAAAVAAVREATEAGAVGKRTSTLAIMGLPTLYRVGQLSSTTSVPAPPGDGGREGRPRNETLPTFVGPLESLQGTPWSARAAAAEGSFSSQLDDSMDMVTAGIADAERLAQGAAGTSDTYLVVRGAHVYVWQPSAGVKPAAGANSRQDDPPPTVPNCALEALRCLRDLRSSAATFLRKGGGVRTPPALVEHWERGGRETDEFWEALQCATLGEAAAIAAAVAAAAAAVGATEEALDPAGRDTGGSDGREGGGVGGASSPSPTIFPLRPSSKQRPGGFARPRLAGNNAAPFKMAEEEDDGMMPVADEGLVPLNSGAKGGMPSPSGKLGGGGVRISECEPNPQEMSVGSSC